jgi:hypothetical protein
MSSLMAKLVFTREQEPAYQSENFLEVLRLLKNDDAFYAWLLQQPQAEASPAMLLKNFQKSSNLHQIPSTSSSRGPKLIDLTNDRSMEAIHPGLCGICDWLVQRGIYPREYAWQVMNLRKGDTVQFGDRKFILGNFLGRGNAKHVWEVADQSDMVLHIPFYSGPPKESKGGDTATLTYLGPQSGRLFLAQYVKKARWLEPLDVPMPRIIAAGENNSYLLTTRIAGKQNGRDFLLKEYQLRSSDPHVSSKYTQLRRRIDQLRRFIQLNSRPFPTAFHPYQNEEEMLLAESRQFLFNGKDWVLLDWD